MRVELEPVSSQKHSDQRGQCLPLLGMKLAKAALDTRK